MIDPVVKYIVTQHSSFIHIYVYDAFRKRGINVKKIITKLHSLYGENFNGDQFIEFGEKYLDTYLQEKHSITFNDLLLEAFKDIIPRFRHLVK